jgi:hypothetical protein
MITPRDTLMRSLIEAATADERIVALVDYGSGSFGRADAWSDLDVAVFIRDGDFAAFEAGWKRWAAQFGRLLLAYVGRYGHPWAVYDTAPVPLRVDFDLWRASQTAVVASWPNSPLNVEAMVLYDATDGRLSAAVQQIVGQSLAPADLNAAFDEVCGDLWYFLIYVHCKLQRGEHWVARMVFYTEVLHNLLLLLRVEAGAVERWRESPDAFEVERALSAERLTRLEGCVAQPGSAGLRKALLATATLGSEVCAALAARHGWPWPAELASRTLALLR